MHPLALLTLLPLQQGPSTLFLAHPAELDPLTPPQQPWEAGGSPIVDPTELPEEGEPPLGLDREEWRRWLEEHAASTLTSTRVRGAVGGLLVTGPPAELEEFAAFAKQAEALLAASRIAGTVELTVAGEPSGRQSFHVLPGQPLVLGQLQTRPFVGSWRAQVAADSAVAEPAVWLQRRGWQVELSAARVGTSEVLVAGRFLRTTEASPREFDPDTPDLGTIEQPVLHHTELGFRALASPDLPVLLRAKGPDGQEVQVQIAFDRLPALPAPGGWTAVETAGLNLALPGTEEDPLEGWSASGVAALVGGGRKGPPPLWMGTLVLVPPSAPDVVREATTLVSSLLPQGPGASIRIEAGPSWAEVPVLPGPPQRIGLGTVTTAVESYRTELATDAWIAEPEVRIHHFGLSGTLRWGADSVAASLLQTQETERARRPADVLAQIGALESVDVNRRGSALVASAAREAAVGQSSPLPAVRIVVLP